jgi:RNA polymerase sigma factor (sigma-70 family)
MGVTDEEQLSSALAGDREALGALLEAHGPEVRERLGGAIPKRWRSLLALDDVMQQAYADAFLDIGQFVPQGEGSFTAWLLTIAKRNLLDALRLLEAEKRGGGRKQVKSPPGDESFVALCERLGSTSSTPSRKVVRSEACGALQRAVKRLPQAQRRVVQMYDLEGRPIGEVSATLGRSEGAIYMLRARAHRRLCEIMGTASKYLSSSS